MKAKESTKPKKEKKELKGGLLTLWQLVKFSIVGMIGGLIQLGLQYLLPLYFDRFTKPLPPSMDFLFNTQTLFDVNTAKGAMDYAKYIIDGRVTWGYVLPFFLANIIANIFCYIENKKRTFKSDAPRWHFTIYFVIMVLTIVFTTWVQGIFYPWLIHFNTDFINRFARLICLIPVGLIQTAVFFVTQKILLPPRDEHKDEDKKEDGKTEDKKEETEEDKEEKKEEPVKEAKEENTDENADATAEKTEPAAE